MTIDAWIMTGLLVGMFALLVWDQLPTWSEFIGTLTLAITLNLAPLNDLLADFSNPGVITMIASKVLVGLPDKIRQAQLKILPSTAGASAFLSNKTLKFNLFSYKNI
jgi:hypothetical protein